MSTADSYLYALASHSVILCTGRAPTRALIRWHILGYGVLLTIATLLYRDVIGLTVLTGAILLIVAVPMLYVINGGRDPLRFVLLLSGGYVGALVGILTLGLIPDAGAFVLVGCLVDALVPTKLLRS